MTEIGKNKSKQDLIEALLNDIKGPKDFLDLMQEIKKAFAYKVDMDFEGEELNKWSPEVAIPDNSKDISVTKPITQQEKLVDGIYRTALEMRMRGMKWPDIQASLKELYEKDTLVLVQSILTTAISNVVNELEEWENEG